MLRFDKGLSRFNFRAVAVILQEEKILLHKSKKDEFWALPGGRVEFFEFSNSTISREIFEEIGLKSKVLRPLWYVENFFEFEGYKYHEIANYFLTELIEKVDTKLDIEAKEEDLGLIFRWFRLDEIDKITLLPIFLKTELLNLPKTPKMILFDEISD